MILETERLILDTWQSADWTELRPIATDVEVMRYITGGVPWSDEQIRAFVDRQVELHSTQGFCRWKLLEKPDRRMIGFCGVGLWRNMMEPEIGWWLERPRWGRGLASEAAVVALRDAFERVQLNRIVSIAMVANAASRRIMEKLGLKFDSEFENEGFRLVKYAMDRAGYAGPRREARAIFVDARADAAHYHMRCPDSSRNRLEPEEERIVCPWIRAVAERG